MRLLFRPSRLTAVAALAFLACVASRAHAGYAMVAPPPAVLTSGGTTTIAVGSAANSATYGGGYVMARGSLTIGARTVTVPIAYRVAANAATFAATRLNPYIAGATMAYGAWQLMNEWFDRSPATAPLTVTPDGRLEVGGVVNPNTGSYTTPFGESATYRCENPSASLSFRPRGESCTGGGQFYWAICNPAPGGMVCVGAGSEPSVNSTPPRPATDADVSPLGNNPINPAVLPAIGEPIPVDPVPVINPATVPTGDVLVGPSGNPAPQVQPTPFRVPDGEPIPIPNTNPPQYTQPWLEIVPAPTPSEPYRVDVRPITTIVNSPAPVAQPVNVDPTTNPGTPTQADLCQKYPNIVACQPPGDVTDSPNPAQPRLYERKYPDGFAGVWDAKKAQLMATPVAQLMSNIMPRVGDGGCPRWEINLNVGIHDYGTHPLGIPCEYWGYIRVILIISALFMARALIFGG